VGRPKDGPGDLAFHFASRYTLVFGPEKGLKAALDVAGGKRNKGPLDDGLALVGKQHMFSAFAIPTKATQFLKDGMSKDPQSKQYAPLAEVQSGTVAINLNNKKMEFEVGLKYPDDGKAKAARDTLDKLVKAAPGLLLVAGAMMDGKISEDLSKAVETIKVEQSSATVNVKFQLDSSILTGAARMPLGAMGDPGPGPNINPPKGPIINPPKGPANKGGKKR
jgi:hypothetical protein